MATLLTSYFSDILKVTTYLNMFGAQWLHDILEEVRGENPNRKVDLVQGILSVSHEYYREDVVERDLTVDQEDGTTPECGNNKIDEL